MVRIDRRALTEDIRARLTSAIRDSDQASRHFHRLDDSTTGNSLDLYSAQRALEAVRRDTVAIDSSEHGGVLRDKAGSVDSLAHDLESQLEPAVDAQERCRGELDQALELCYDVPDERGDELREHLSEALEASSAGESSARDTESGIRAARRAAGELASLGGQISQDRPQDGYFGGLDVSSYGFSGWPVQEARSAISSAGSSAGDAGRYQDDVTDHAERALELLSEDPEVEPRPEPALEPKERPSEPPPLFYPPGYEPEPWRNPDNYRTEPAPPAKRERPPDSGMPDWIVYG